MSKRSVIFQLGRPRTVVHAALVGVLGLGMVTMSAADDGKKGVVVGKVGLVAGLVHRTGDGAPWQILPPRAQVNSEETIIGVPAGPILSKNGHVQLTVLSDLARVSPYPVLECAVRIHDSSDYDLDFTLERGRANVSNRRQDGQPAKVRVRFHGSTWDLTLDDADSSVALELFGRWPKGIPFRKVYKPDEKPTSDMVMIVRRGQVDLKLEGRQFAMRAPPGPAYFHWDSVGKNDEAPKYLDGLPAWASTTALLVPKATDITEIAKLIRGRLGQAPTSIEDTVGNALNSEAATARKLAVFLLGALDDLPRLTDCLIDPKHADIRDVAIMALRHWIGRGPGQDQKLYDVLVKDKKYTEKQAETVMQLLHSFGDEQVAQPATYETLIELLAHEKLAIRELASWHLERLVPAGRDIPYDPTAAMDQLKAAQAKWKELIPDGKLPPDKKDK